MRFLCGPNSCRLRLSVSRTDPEPQDPSSHARGDGWRHREEAWAERHRQRVSVCPAPMAAVSSAGSLTRGCLLGSLVPADSSLGAPRTLSAVLTLPAACGARKACWDAHVTCHLRAVSHTHPVSHPLSHAHRSCPMHPVSHVPRVIYTSCCTHSGVTQPLSRPHPRAGHHLFLEQILWSAHAQTRVCEIVLSVELQRILAQVEMWLSLVPAPVARQGKIFHSLKRALGVFSRARRSIPQLSSKKLELPGGAGAQSALERWMAALTARGGPVWASSGPPAASTTPGRSHPTRPGQGGRSRQGLRVSQRGPSAAPLRLVLWRVARGGWRSPGAEHPSPADPLGSS